ncbi:MAG: hypothetical protein IKP40_08430 [Clostridia bacterium]|nr:hypothetical protein [Clostridia bacterium]
MTSLTPLLDPTPGETLLSPGLALRDFIPRPDEDAQTLRGRIEEAVREGKSLGEVRGGSLTLEPLTRLRTAAARRSPEAEDCAVDGLRCTLRLTLASWKDAAALCAALSAPGGCPPFPLTWIGETPSALLALCLPQAIPIAPLKLNFGCEGTVEAEFIGEVLAVSY